MPQLRRLLCPLALGLSACGGNPGTSGQLGGGDKAAIVAAVDSAMHGYLDAVAARDADRVIGYFANDPEFLAYFDATPMNYEAMSNTVHAMFGGLRSVQLQPVTVHVTVLGRDAAIAGFSFREAFTDTAGRVSPVHGTASWTWRQQNGQWRIIHGDAVHLPDTTASRR